MGTSPPPESPNACPAEPAGFCLHRASRAVTFSAGIPPYLTRRTFTPPTADRPEAAVLTTLDSGGASNGSSAQGCSAGVAAGGPVTGSRPRRLQAPAEAAARRSAARLDRQVDQVRLRHRLRPRAARL